MSEEDLEQVVLVFLLLKSWRTQVKTSDSVDSLVLEG
jgi:hypothetical protein